MRGAGSQSVRPARRVAGRSRRVGIGCRRELAVGRSSPRVAAVGETFGIPLHGRTIAIAGDRGIPLSPGRIILLLGPSGSGKSSVLQRIDEQCIGACSVQRIGFPPSTAIIDRVAPGAPLADALALLTRCGLGDAHLWVRRFDTLSDGERFRARLARAIAIHQPTADAQPLLCDEFCSLLHRRAARAIAFSLRKLVTQRGMCMVLASVHDDIVADLQPDTIVRFDGAGGCAIETRAVRPNKPISLRRSLRIEPGVKRDYEALAGMHYRATAELGFVDKVFVLRDRGEPQPLGIVVYSHGPLELALRNRATGGRFSRNPEKLNRSFRILRRLVIHPDLRGCGLGHYLVRKTLPLVGTLYVECLAGMGEFNPVFEKAGMTRVGRYPPPPGPQRAVRALREMDVDPNGMDFPRLVCRRPRVRSVVAAAVKDWYAATTAEGERRVARQSPELLAQLFRGVIGSRPVYYLWRRGRPAGRGRGVAGSP